MVCAADGETVVELMIYDLWPSWLPLYVGLDFEGFSGLESPERIGGPLPDQTRIRPYFWNESDSGVPSDLPPNLLPKKNYLKVCQDH